MICLSDLLFGIGYVYFIIRHKKNRAYAMIAMFHSIGRCCVFGSRRLIYTSMNSLCVFLFILISSPTLAIITASLVSALTVKMKNSVPICNDLSSIEG